MRQKRNEKYDARPTRSHNFIFSVFLFLVSVDASRCRRRQRRLPINDCSTCHSHRGFVFSARPTEAHDFVLIDFITFEIVYYFFFAVTTTTTMFDSHVQRRFHPAPSHIQAKLFPLYAERRSACNILRLVYVYSPIVEQNLISTLSEN